MGYLASASTIYARAYLTSRGREYLFNNQNVRFNNQGQDLFEIKTFTLGDPDVNYLTAEVLPEGGVPDLSGTYDTCLKTALDYEQRNLLFYQNFDQVVADNIDYTTDANGNILNVNVNLSDNDISVGVDGNTNGRPLVDANGNTLINTGGNTGGNTRPLVDTNTNGNTLTNGNNITDATPNR